MAAHSSKIVIYAALGGNALIAVTKFIAASFTGSSAMFSEGVHSLVDTGNQMLLLFGMRQAAKPATPRHPFGFGLSLYFWAFVVAILIFGLGAGISFYEGIDKVRHPHVIENAWINYVVLGLAILFEGAVWIVALRAFRAEKGDRGWLRAVRESKDPTVFTVLFEDSAALLGLVAALIGVFFAQTLNMPVLDGVASIVIGCILSLTAGFLAYECRSLLTGEGVAPPVRASIHELAERGAGVGNVNELLTMHFGPADVLVALSLDFDNAISAEAVEDTVSAIERSIKAAHPEVTRVFIEAQSLEAHRRNAAAGSDTLSPGSSGVT